MKKGKLFIILLLVVIFIVTIVFAIKYIMPKEDNEEVKKTNSNESVDKLNKNELAVKINAVLKFNNSISNNPGIENQLSNNYNIVVSIYLNGEKKPIYESSKIKPGEIISKVKLNRHISKGTYNAIAYFNAYDDDNNYMGKSGVEIKLKVE